MSIRIARNGMVIAINIERVSQCTDSFLLVNFINL